MLKKQRTIMRNWLLKLFKKISFFAVVPFLLFLNGNFRLKSNSPAVGKSAWKAEPATDYFDGAFKSRRTLGGIE